MELYDEKIEQEILKSGIPVLVEFFAKWCGPCRVMEPVINEISEQLHGKIKVFIINIEKAQEPARNFPVLSLPTVLIYKNGKKIIQLSGVQKKDALLDFLV